MDSKNIIFNKSIDQYTKKYRNGRYKLLKYTKKEVEEFDKVANQSIKTKNYLLNSRKWALIGDTYYEIPKAPRWTWFRNLNAGVQAGTYAAIIGGVACAIALPLTLKPQSANPFKDDIAAVDTINEKIKGSTFDTCYDFVNGVSKRAQIDITNLKPVNENAEYVFDKEDNKVALVNKEDLSYIYPKKTSEKNNIWRFVSTVDENAEYSQYIKDDYNYLIEPTSLKVKSGIDAGECDFFETINYENENEATNIIRTNGGALVVDAKEDTVKHYGTANNILVSSIASNSYHEYGEVSSLSIASGRLVVEKEAHDIKSINIVKPEGKSESEPVKIDIQNEGVSEEVINKEEGAKFEKVIINDVDKTAEIEDKEVTAISIDDTEGKGQVLINKIITDASSKIKEIVLKSDIKVVIGNPTEANSSGINVTRELNIEGNGYSLNGEEEATTTARHHNVLGIRAKNAEVNINNLNINYDDSLNTAGYNESIRVENAYKSNITLNGVTNTKHKNYAMYIYNNNEAKDSLANNGIDIKVNNCNFIGYSAVKSNGNNITFTGQSSIFTGVNENSLSPSNDCDTIQIGYPFWNTGLLNCDNTFKFWNCTLNAIFVPGVTCTEYIFDSLSPLNNVLEFNYCEFNSSGNPGHGEDEYHYVSICEEDYADLNNTDIASHCGSMSDEKFKSITTVEGLFEACPRQHYITVDFEKYGYDDEKEYIKDDRFKVGIINADGDNEFEHYTD